MEELQELEQLRQWLPLLIPILLLQWGLVIFALVDLVRRGNTKGSKWGWLAVILLINFIGPILYLILGRDE